MLLPYDNDVIPIAKNLQRSFEDDHPTIPVNPETKGQPPDNKPQPPHDDEHVDKSADGRNSTPTKPSPPVVQPGLSVEQEPLHDLRQINPSLNPHDVQLSLKNCRGFNDYFYKIQRDLFDGPEKTFHSLPQLSMYKVDPQADDRRKQDLMFSVAQSLKDADKLDGRIPSKLPIPEAILGEAKAHLRRGEISCWDFTVKKAEEEEIVDPDELLIITENQVMAEEQPFKWISHGEFNVDTAVENLNEFFRVKWMRGEHWRVHIKLHTRKFKQGGVTAYIFETCWSIPTRKQPIAQSTCSIFFVMDVCSAKKPEAPIIVSCHYENSPMIFDPLKIKFGAEIFADIMERKRLLAQRLIY